MAEVNNQAHVVPMKEVLSDIQLTASSLDVHQMVGIMSLLQFTLGVKFHLWKECIISKQLQWFLKPVLS